MSTVLTALALQQSDSSHLLENGYQTQYGSINPSGSHTGHQPDPEEIRRQRDALERICAQTSELVSLPAISPLRVLANVSPLSSKLIDVSQATHMEDGSKIASEYLRLFNDRFPSARPQSSRPSSADAADEDEITWLEHIIGNTTDAEGSWDRVNPIDSGALTVQLGDVR